jgi:hypothetical protein
MKNSKNLETQTFGRLYVVCSYLNDVHNRRKIWRCICSCGNNCKVDAYRLHTGKTQSCGCLRSEASTKRMTSHGLSASPTYRTWDAVIQRCTNPKSESFPSYGGKGVSVCDRWLDFNTFVADMGERPDGCTIDRIDGSGNYQPDNCRWATPTIQRINQSIRVNNTSGYRGVHFHKRLAKWQASIGFERQYYHMGYFDSANDAARAYDAAAIKYHGEFAHLNFPA